MTPVTLPPKVRAVAYLIYGVVGVAMTATQAGFAAASTGQPVALTVAWAVYGVLGTGFGLVAANNTGEADPTPLDDVQVPDHLDMSVGDHDYSSIGIEPVTDPYAESSPRRAVDDDGDGRADVAGP